MEDIIMKYVINISSDNFENTPFFGEEFDSIDSLRAIWRKYIPKQKGIVKLSFSNYATIEHIKKRGDELAKEGKDINLFELASLYKKDDLYGYTIWFSHNGWYDEKGSFKFILETPNGKLNPCYNSKLRAILVDLDISID